MFFYPVNTNQHFPPTPTTHTGEKAKRTKSMRFAPNTKGLSITTHSCNTGMFLSKTGHRSRTASAAPTLPWDQKRKFYSYFKATIPGNPAGTDKTVKCLENFRWLLNRLFRHNSRLILLPFPLQPDDGTKARPVQKDASLISQRDKLKPCTNRLWIGEGRRIFINVLWHMTPNKYPSDQRVLSMIWRNSRWNSRFQTFKVLK